MRKTMKFYESIKIRILIMMLILFSVAALFLSALFGFNLGFLALAIIIMIVLYGILNKLITKPIRELTATAQKLADGDIYTLVPYSILKQKSEIGQLARAINEMSSVYQSMLQSTENLFDAANAGKLSVRNDASNYKGDVQKVIRQINETLDATTLYLNSSPEGILIIGKDFETYFKNEQYIKYFGDMPARALIEKIFPANERKTSNEQFAEFLKQENKNAKIWIGELCFSIVFKEIELAETTGNSVLVIIMDITDLMREKENAQEAARAKSNFLSGISHEIRTPMNAIIGMTKIAANTEDISKLKYCLHTIANSSEHLLSIINDVLDMSKIEAGKFELKSGRLSIERLLMRTCSIVIDSMEAKNQKFDVIIGDDLHHNYYIGDELRLSQVITNMLSNAIKFTPDYGKISLKVNEVFDNKGFVTLRFAVSDTGIGIKEEQISKLFGSFEQIDGSITRQYGGTGLGLAISKNIIEKMNGRIWVESDYGKGSVFIFEVKLKRAPSRDRTVFEGVHPKELRVLFVENDNDITERFRHITSGFNITADIAVSVNEAAEKIEAAFKAGTEYDVVFLKYNMPVSNGLDIISKLDGMVNTGSIVMITSFIEWHIIEKNANQLNIDKYITIPMFPSAVLNVIGEVLSAQRKKLIGVAGTSDSPPDFSGVSILLVEDIALNREIFSALLAETGISVDFAENGVIAVSKFKENHDKYDIIIMDIEMPEMDGYEATKTIRSMDGISEAKTIPIIAMTANVFREDIDRCLACGMDNHLPKPIDEKLVIEKISKYIAYRRPA